MARAGHPRRKPARARRGRTPARDARLSGASARELREVRAQLAQLSQGRPALRWNADPQDLQRSVLRLVLTLVEFVRKLLERQAIRRMDAGTLTDAETEDVGRALMALESTVQRLSADFGLAPEDLNLDLGPLGKML